VIRLRSLFERGRAHPVLGPLLLLALVFLLAMVFLHVVLEGVEAAELGAMCVAIASVLGLLLVYRPPVHHVPQLIGTSNDRAPPARTGLTVRTLERSPPLAAISIPLRR
jgi:hypothetical protein